MRLKNCAAAGKRGLHFLFFCLVLAVFAFGGCSPDGAAVQTPGGSEYGIVRTSRPPSLLGEWDSAIWQKAATGEIANFHPKSSAHRPRIFFRMLYDDHALYLIFRVEDQYVRSRVTTYQGAVYMDSCVEFFVKPKPDKGYFNFEINAGGALLCSYIENPERLKSGEFKTYTQIPAAEGQAVRIYHSAPSVIDPEIAEPFRWTIEAHIPLALLERYAGPLRLAEHREWRANFNKCDSNSHPHWATWAPLPTMNFHSPENFGRLHFMP